jgi:hypothetical protein
MRALMSGALYRLPDCPAQRVCRALPALPATDEVCRLDISRGVISPTIPSTVEGDQYDILLVDVVVQRVLPPAYNALKSPYPATQRPLRVMARAH